MSDERDREPDELFERHRLLWKKVMAGSLAATQGDLGAPERQSVRELARDCGLPDANANGSVAELLRELAEMYRHWAKRLTKDAGGGPELLEAYIRECPIRFLRGNAQRMLAGMDRAH